MDRHDRLRAWRVLVLATALAVTAGCGGRRFSPFTPTAPTVVTVPQADSPVNAVRRLAWVWSQRDAAAYQAMLTSDFRSVFSYYADGAVVTQHPDWGVQHERAAAKHLLVGGGSLTAPTSIAVSVADAMLDLPDPRPGKDPRFHRMVTTTYDLTIEASPGGTDHQGTLRAYLVRGDSALVPPDVFVLRDATRWFLEGWDDLSVLSVESIALASPARPDAAPGKSLTWGQYKLAYLSGAGGEVPDTP